MFLAKLQRRWRWWRLKLAGADVSYDLQSASAFFEGEPSGLKCGRGMYICTGARILIDRTKEGVGSVEIGDYFFVNYYAIIDCHYRVTIGDRVMIGPHVYIGDFDHDVS